MLTRRPPDEIAASGRRLSRAAVAVPWIEPLEAYRRLRAAGHAPLLLDGLGAHPAARYAYVAFDPVAEVRVTADLIEERWGDAEPVARRASPVDYLRGLTERHRYDVEEPEGFSGGWLGYFGFGFARVLEPSLPEGPPGEVADAMLRLCPSALVLDRHKRSGVLYGAALDGDLELAKAGLERAARALSSHVAEAPAPSATPQWVSSFTPEAFQDAVSQIKALIASGDLFQANLATRFRAALACDPADLFAALQRSNPSPFMALMEFDDLAIVSGSPEMLLAVRDGRVRSRPIAGTRRRGRDAGEDAAMESELLTDVKERAEHTMLVDLVRNDLARVGQAGSVRVTEWMSVERYRHVMHLASEVEARLRPETGFVDWLAALFPGGTVSGAPKVRAMQRILETEPVARGPYTGSAGYLSWSHNSQLNILIRGLVLRGGVADVGAGSGIVADSDPLREWKESVRKARALLDAATQEGGRSDGPTRLGEVRLRGTWSPPRPGPGRSRARVLLIDNFDSFVHNLADYCGMLGASTRVVRNDAEWRAEVEAFRPTHLVLSPGPGWPGEAGCSLEVAREMGGRLPILGVCLGHQAVAAAAGARVRVHPRGPCHGKTDAVHHGGEGLFVGLPSPLRATRYHSLVVEGLGPDWIVDACLEDDTVMAVRHRTQPTFGLQFHPESIGTERGMDLLRRFLA